MAPLNQAALAGRKGGESKPRDPYVAPDSLRSIARVKMLVALGEGEFEGRLTGRDIYLDGTPLLDANGNPNFSGVRWEFRPGSQHQSYIPGLPAVENDIALNVELRSGTPYVRAVSNVQLSAVRLRLRWPALQRQQSNGDLVGYSIAYAVDVQTDGGAYVEVLSTAVTGKASNPYERSHRINLPAATTGWQIRVRRLTPNQNSPAVADTMQITGFTEVIDIKLRYPNTALLYVEFDSSQFSNTPVVACEPYGRIWQVPSNYDPETRTYSGAWDGSFKSAWTDNPAWVTYGVITNERFGLGKRIKAAMVDKWELYRIAQYCDQLVPDGKGGMEPRFTCSLYIQSRAEAWTVLRDLAAIYRGMTYWAQGQMVTVADMPRDVDFVYSRANVVEGRFTYSGSSERTRYTRALVSYDNPGNAYETDVAVASDIKLQRRYGDTPLELTAIGCVRESEAQRRGKWAILTNASDRTVTFQVGLDGKIPLPGYIIGIADQMLAGRPLGGRISAFTAPRTLTLDRESSAKPGDRLVINLPSGKAEGRTVQAVAGRDVTVTTAYSETPAAQLQWAVDADDLAIQQFRVNSVARDDRHLFTITATQHNPSKFEAIDTGARLEDRPITVIPPGVQAPPSNVRITASTAVSQGLAVTTATIAWDAPENAVAYDVDWRRDDGDWIRLPRTGSTSADIVGIYAGDYLARVRAVSAIDVSSLAATSALTALAGKVGDPPGLAFFTASPAVFSVRLRWGFPASGAADTAYTEVMQNSANNDNGAVLLGQYAYPISSHVLTGLAAGSGGWFKARLVDRLGNAGPWTAWVLGQASSNQADYDAYFNGRINASALAQELLEQIDSGGDAMVVVQELINELATMYTVKTQLTADGRTYLAGIGVGIENNDGIVESQVLLAASRVAIIDPNTGESSIVSPFVVQGGQVFINSAVINSATIQQALIGQTLESVAKLPNGDPVLSLNFQTGEIKLNGTAADGRRLSINNQLVQVFDANGTLRVRLGIWG